jgi:predicted LPLAT superfamily acyltransferase
MSAEPSEHWSVLRERGGVLGLRIMFGVYRRLGRSVVLLLLYPVVAYFWLTADKPRRASRYYLGKVRARLAELGRSSPEPLTTFNHILHFAKALLDKGAMWGGWFSQDGVEFDDPAQIEALRARRQGALLIGSHHGNLEMLRGFGESHGLKVNALVSTRNSPKLNRALSIVSPRAFDRMTEVDSLGPDAVIKLEAWLAAGEHVAIVGDRVSVRHKERSVYAPFFGRPAPFPEGPFVLASLLACPVYLVFCSKVGAKYRVYLEPFSDAIVLPRERRREALEHEVARYASRLEAHCLLAPTQWFNFFDFWDQGNGYANGNSNAQVDGQGNVERAK